MISNISRHIDYMSSNVKYVQIGAVQENKEIFAVILRKKTMLNSIFLIFHKNKNLYNFLIFLKDEFMSGKFKIECKIALNNCKDLLNSLSSLCEIVQKVN